MGLGGYFVVTEVKNAIEAGKFQTDLKCVWQSAGTGKPDTSECEDKKDCQDGTSGPGGTGSTATPPAVGDAPEGTPAP
jgi:hypothetical protein